MDLEKYLHVNSKLDYEETRNLWRQMLCAVSSIHKQGIIHTDLKPANFLFVDSALKLIDFGIAKGLQVHATYILFKLCTCIFKSDKTQSEKNLLKISLENLRRSPVPKLDSSLERFIYHELHSLFILSNRYSGLRALVDTYVFMHIIKLSVRKSKALVFLFVIDREMHFEFLVNSAGFFKASWCVV